MHNSNKINLKLNKKQMENTLWLIWSFNTYNALTLRVAWTRRYGRVYLGVMYQVGVKFFFMGISDVWVVQERWIYVGLPPQYLFNLFSQISIVSHPSQLLTINDNVEVAINFLNALVASGFQ